MSEMSILSFVAQMGVMHAEMRHLEHEALERACEIIQHEARAAVGTYRLGWPQLAQSTQDDRVRKGFPANEPLLRTGELRDLIQHQVIGSTGYVGSNDQRAVWNFLGTSRIPPRDPIVGAAHANVHQVEEAVGHAVVMWLGGRGRRS